jgi:RNA polymerase sigma-70 factor (ECF subfamily)
VKARIEALYIEYGAMVHRRCLFILKDEEAAYDALQEVFLKLMDSAALVERMKTPVSYLYRMATNVCLNILRRDRARAHACLVPVEELVDEREDGLAAALLVELLSASLGPRTRAIAYYRYIDGLGLDEIAEDTGLSRSAVRKRLDKFKEEARRHKERIV